MKKRVVGTLSVVAAFGLLGLCVCTSCKKDKGSGDGAEMDSLVTVAPIMELEMEEILTDGSVSVGRPKGWKGYVTDYSIEVMKPMEENHSRKAIFMELMVYPMGMSDYLKQSSVPEESKVDEFTYGKNNWVVYDRTELGYPAVYLTEMASKTNVLCVRCSGFDVVDGTHPGVLQVLASVSIQDK